jgi:aminoglycoside phosphotransferase (APT) family kinase protein
MGLNQLSLTEHGGRRAVRKRYAIDDPRLFRSFGTGARNEALLKSRLGDLIPTELSAETSPDGYDEVCLEWRDGRSLEPHEFDGGHAHATGFVLARIHALTGAWYGSIDGRHRFERQADAFAPRWSHAIKRLNGVDSKLASDLDRWGQERLARLRWPRPTLVHGDFGITNLLWTGSTLGSVLDWEYARFGDPREDWSKVATGVRFPEPNSLGFDDTVLGALREGYLSGGGSAAAFESVALYDAYYAAVVGVVLESAPRLSWLSELAQT